jgi:(p)ppGpp synthase/HD superfamily hydrolase
MSNVKTALNIVETTFAGKKDLAGKPYIDHLKRVSENAKNSSNSQKYEFDEVEIVALLHDLLEDFGDEWQLKHIRAIFTNGLIVDALSRLTKKKNEDYQEYIKRVAANSLSKIVKVADLRDNMDIARFDRPLTESDLERLKKYHDAYLFLTENGTK